MAKKKEDKTFLDKKKKKEQRKKEVKTGCAPVVKESGRVVPRNGQYITQKRDFLYYYEMYLCDHMKVCEKMGIPEEFFRKEIASNEHFAENVLKIDQGVFLKLKAVVFRKAMDGDIQALKLLHNYIGKVNWDVDVSEADRIEMGQAVMINFPDNGR